MSGTGEDRRELQTLPGTQPFQRDAHTRKVEPNAPYETKASSKGNSGSSSIPWFSGLWLRMSGELHYHSLCFRVAQGIVLTPPAHTAKSISPAERSEELCRRWEGPVLSLSQPGCYSPGVSFDHRISSAASSSSLAPGSGVCRLLWLEVEHKPHLLPP